MSIQNPFDSHVRCNQSQTSPSGYPYRVDEGGTEAFTALEGLDNLEAVPYSTIGDPNSVSPLDDLAMIPDEFCPEADIEQAPHIEGPTVVSAGQTAIFTITNYSYNSQYTIASIGSGTVEQFTDKVYYHAPVQASMGGDGFTINDRPISITVEGTASLAIETPSILIPQNSSIDIGPDPFIVSSAFISTGFPQTHASSDWEIRQRLPGGDVISLKYSSYNNTVNKTDWYPGLLEPSSTYYLRVRYHSHLGNVSEWSEICIFNTASTFAGSINYVSRPTIVSRTRTDYPYVDKPEIIQYADDKIDQEIVTTLQSTPYSYNGPTDNVTDVASLHELTTREFSYSGVQQTHVSTLWEVSKSSNFDTLVLRTTDSFTFKNSLILRDLDDNQTYYVRCKHIGHLTGESPWSYTFSFNTGVAYTVETLSVGDGDSNKTLSDIDHPRVGYGASMTVNDARSILCVADDDRFYNDGADISYVGCVSIYHKENGGWVQNTTLRNSDYSAEQYFGRRLAMSSDGTILAVSAPNKLGGDGHRGYVYLYTYSGTTQSWSEIDILGDTGITGMEEFGHSLSLTGNGDRLAVTFKKTDLAVTTRGVILYKLENGHWVYDYTINICEDDGFMEVVINHIGDKFYVVYNHSNDYLTSHTYEMREYREFPSNPMPDGWLDTTVYTRDYPADCQIDRITFDVSRDENIAAVGIIAYYDGTNNHTYRGDSNIYNGYVDIVTRSFLEDDIIPVTRWGYQTTIENNNRLYRDRFGSHVKLNQDGTALLISAEYTDVDTGELNRSSYVFYRTDRYWTQHYQFTMPVHELMGLGPTLNKEGTYIYYTNQTTFMVKEQSFNRFADQEHIGSTWQIATDIPYTEIQQQNARDRFIKTRYTTQELEPETKYYPRMRQIGRITGESPWSDLIEVNTKPIDVILGGELYIVHPLHEVVGYDPVRTDAYGYNFSTDMDISGNGEVLVVGAPGKSTPFNTNTGAAYVYRDFSMVDYNYTDIKILEGNKLNLTHLYNNGYNWSSLAVVGGTPYATVMGGDVYELSQDGRIFQSLNLPLKNWVASCGVGHDLYLAEQNGDIYKVENVNNGLIPIEIENNIYGVGGINTLESDVVVGTMYPTESSDYGFSLWRQTNSIGDFTPCVRESKNWSGLAFDAYGVLFACEYDGDLYRIDTATGQRRPLNQGTRLWSSMSGNNFQIYACVFGGDIYRLNTNGSVIGNDYYQDRFIALNQTNRDWSAITNWQHAYAAVYNGDIYKQRYLAGNFNPLNLPSKLWSGLAMVDSVDFVACTEGQGIYRYIHSTGILEPLDQSSTVWSGIHIQYNVIYACQQNGDIYVKSISDTVGDFVRLDKYCRTNHFVPLSKPWSGIAGIGSGSGSNHVVVACTTEGDLYIQDKINGNFNLMSYGLAYFDGIFNVEDALYTSTPTGLNKITPSGLTFLELDYLALGGIYQNMIKIDQDIYALETAYGVLKFTNSVFPIAKMNYRHQWSGMAVNNGVIYACVPNGDIYTSNDNGISFTALGLVFRNWAAMGVCNGNIYVCVQYGDIYKQSGGVGSFTALGQTSRTWMSVAGFGNDVYAAAWGSGIYKQANALGSFTLVYNHPQPMSLIVVGSYLYLIGYSGTLYRKNDQNDLFTQIGNTFASFSGGSFTEFNGQLLGVRGNNYLKNGIKGNFPGGVDGGVFTISLTTGKETPTIIAGDVWSFIGTDGVSVYLCTDRNSTDGVRCFRWSSNNCVIYGPNFDKYNRQWISMFLYNGYLCVYNQDGSVYRKIIGEDNFEVYPDFPYNTIGQIIDIKDINGDIYISSENGIYKQRGGLGNLIKLQPDTNIYYRSNYSNLVVQDDSLLLDNGWGSAFRISNCSRSVKSLGQTVRNWSGLTSFNMDVYATVEEGDIYKQASATGDFVALEQGNKKWSGISSNENSVVAVVYNGDIYKQTDGVGDFVALSQTPAAWTDIAGNKTSYYLIRAGYNNLALMNDSNVITDIPGENRQHSAIVAYEDKLYVTETLGDAYSYNTYFEDSAQTGISVAINNAGNRLLVGSKHKYLGATPYVGLVDVYEYINNNWVKTHTIKPPILPTMEFVGEVFDPNDDPQWDSFYKVATLGTLDPQNYTVYGIAGQSFPGIYIQTNGNGFFTKIASLSTYENLTGITVCGSNVYVCHHCSDQGNYGHYSGDIYKQTNGVGDFIPLNQTARAWRGMTSLGNNVYACEEYGDIYKQTNGTGDFLPLNQPIRQWFGMATLGNDVYACVYNGDIYKQTDGQGDFMPLNYSHRAWTDIMSAGSDLYAQDAYTDILVRKNNEGPFVSIKNTIDPTDDGYYYSFFVGNTYLDNATYIGLYRYDTWEPAIYRISEDYSQHTHTYFGSGLAVNGDGSVLAIGSGLDHGQVYIYRLLENQYVLEKTLSPDVVSYPDAGDHYGKMSCNIKLNVAGDRLFVSAPGTTVEGANQSGVVYIYQCVDFDWIEEDRLLPPAATTNQNYGWCIDCNDAGDVLMVGCPGKTNPDGSKNGTVYVYNLQTTWSEISTITNSFATDDYYFGTSLSLNGIGDKVYIFSTNIPQNNSCVTLEFTKVNDIWTITNTFKPNDHVGGFSDHMFDGYWQNWILADKLDNRLLLGHALDGLYGHDYVGYIFGYK